MSGSFPPFPNWLRSWRWYYSSFREIAQRLSERLLIASAAGNHPPPTFFSPHRGCFVVFKWLFATALSLFPWVPSCWMRALLVLSAGPCQPGCSPQPRLASATAASAETLTGGPNVCLISPSYRRLICARKIFISVRRSSPLCSFFSRLGTKASDKLREIAPPKCFSPTFTGFFDTRWISDSRKQTIFIQEDTHNCRICLQGSVT